jgi:RAB protein geranylgeranyltransferase component A
LGRKDPTVRRFRHKFIDEEIEYAKINEIFFVKDDTFKVPTSKNDILKLNISDEDKFYLYKFLRFGNLAEFQNNFTNKSHFIFRIFVELMVFSKFDIKRISSSLNSNIFVYPIYGYSEISESVCLLNAYRGVTYLINETLTLEEVENEYKYKFQCEFGTVFSKEFIRQSLIKEKYYIRVILTTKKKFGGRFLAFYDLEEADSYFIDFKNTENHDKYFKVIGLDSSCGICDENLQLLYFIKKYSEVTNSEVKMLNIYQADIILDISYSTNCDINQFF